MQPPSLRSLSKTVIVRTLVCKSGDCTERKLLIELFRSSQGSCFSEDVLIDIIENFPQQLTDELLYVLAPKHMRNLKMKGCSCVTCDGLAKVIARCGQLNQIDFSGCLRLLHPTVFCCLKDFAPHVRRLIFEDCEIMMDDSVQIILMCCPQLEHLNISSCRNITDAAFDLKTSTDKNKLSPRVQQAGKNLSSVDVSGCQSLTSIAIQNLVALCGSTLVSINIAWTGVGCIALLYLSGLSQKDVYEFVQQADPSCSGLLEKTAEDEIEGDAISTSCLNESIDVESDLTSAKSHPDEHLSTNVVESLEKTPKDILVHNDEHQPVVSSSTSFGYCVTSSIANDSQAIVFCDGESSNQKQEDLFIGSVNHSNTFNQNSEYYRFSQCSTKVDILVSNVQGCKLKNSIQDNLQQNISDNPNGNLANLSEVDAGKNESKVDEHSDQQITLLPDDIFFDDELAWQQINQSCSNDKIWGESAAAVDSLSHAFGEGISCLANAFINLDMSDDDDNDDDGNGSDNGGGGDTDDDGGDDYDGGHDECEDDGVVDIDKNEDNDQNDDGGDCDDNHEDNTIDDNNCIEKNWNLYDSSGVDHRNNKTQRESDPACINSNQIKNNQSDFENCTDLDDQDVIKDKNVNNVHEETPLALAQDSSSIIHKIEDVSTEQKLGYSSVILVDESKIDDDTKNISIDDIGFDQADEHLEEMFNFDEVISDESPSAIHGFSDALKCLSTAVKGLINAVGVSDENDVDDDGDDDNDKDADSDDNDNIGFGGNENESVYNDIVDVNICKNDDDDKGGRDDCNGGSKGNYGDHNENSNDGKIQSEVFSQHQSVCDKEQKIDSFHSYGNGSHGDCSYVDGSHGDGCHNGFSGDSYHGDCSHGDDYHDNGSHGSGSRSGSSHGEGSHGDSSRSDSNNLVVNQSYENNNDSEIDGLGSTSMEKIKLVILPEEEHLSLVSEETQHLTIESENSSTRSYHYSLTHKPQLHAIDVSNIYFHSKALGVACLKMFMAMNKSLNSFATSWSELDDDTLIDLLKQQQELHSLILVDCENISDKSLQLLPAYCPKLKKIDLKGVPFITDCGVVPMLSCPLLKTLSLAEASVTDLSMFAVTEKCGDKLCDLDLSWCEDLTDKGMAAIATACTCLKTLALRQCAAAFVTIEALSNCSRLTSLNIAGIDQLTDQMVVTMATNLPNLTFVDVSWNSSVTSVGVSALMLNCCKLQEANLSGLKALTSKPFLPIISDLYMWRAKQEVMLRHKFKRQKEKGPVQNFIKPCPMEIAIRLGDDLPFRSTTYCPVLRSLILEYSDKVNDDHMAQIVAVCRGTLSVSDYYSQAIEPKWIFFDWTNISVNSGSS